jgi:hypothetical protein
MTSCEECGFSYETLGAQDVAPAISAFGERYRRAMAGTSPDAARRRPAPEVWSPLEYCCHARDVFLVQRDRAVLALVEEGPAFRPMYRDHRVAACRYADQGPEEVLAQLEMAARLLSLLFAGLEPAQWGRTFIYSSGGPHDMTWLGRHTYHEGLHHLMDVGRGLA